MGMERNIRTKAIVCGTRKFGELHKAVTLLCPQLGLVDAIIFGGRKGKKTALAPLFSVCDFQLYFNPVKNEYSIVEGICEFLPSNITMDLQATYSASFLCELISKSPSDDNEGIFNLLQEALKTLESDVSLRKRVIISFVWKLLQLSGTAPDLQNCPLCDKEYEQNEILHFSTSINAPACIDCSDSDQMMMLPGMRRYLTYTAAMDFTSAVQVQLNPQAEDRILTYMLKWGGVFIQGQLKTLKYELLM